MRSFPFVTLDVFTTNRFAGNPLAVVFDADDLTTEEMQAVTREFNLSETTFVLTPSDKQHMAAVRIFTPGYEMPFAGHPTIGAAIALAEARGIEEAMTLELKAGLFPIALGMEKASCFAEFQNPNLPAETGPAPTAVALEEALGLAPGDLDTDRFKPRRTGAGVDFVYARAPLAAVARAKLNYAAFEGLGLDEVVGVYLYAEGGEAPDAAFHARMFAPNAGVAEDPATGSAAAALPGHIAAGGALPDGETRWIVEQGFEMGRPSRIALRVGGAGGAVRSVRVGGSAVIVQRGEIFL